MRHLIIVLCLIIFISNSYGQYTKSLYVEHFPQNILTHTDRENALLEYAKDRGYTSLILYGMQEIFPIRYEQTTTFDYEADLISFINRAKNPPYNITEIGVTEGANWDDEHKQPKIVKEISLDLLTPTGTSTSLGSGDDVISSQINLPFAFNDLDGNPVTKIFASTNGFIELETLQPCASCNTAQYMPDPGVNNPRNIIAGYWSDLNVKTTSLFRYFTNYSSPNRVFVIEWKDVEFKNGGNNGNASFQIQLFEEDKHFEIHIAPGSENPISGTLQTIGISNSTGTIAAGATDQQPTVYRQRHYPRFLTSPNAWEFVPSEAHDWIDQNVYLYNLRNPAEKIDLVSLEFEFWNVNPIERWDAFQYWQRQLETTYRIKTTAAPAQQYTIMPYLHELRDLTWKNQTGSYLILAQSQADFIDSKSDIVGLTYYFNGTLIKQTGLPSYFGYKDALLGKRLELFKSNSYVTKIRALFSAESVVVNPDLKLFGMDYLDRIEGHTWVDDNGITHGYDNWYFGNTKTEDKAFLEFQAALSDPDPYRSGTSPYGYPCGSSTATLGCTMGPPFGSTPDGNILEGVLWLQYGYMPDANFYISGPPYIPTTANQPLTLGFTDNMSSLSVNAPLLPTHQWYKWMYNSIVNSAQYVSLGTTATGATLDITTPHYRSYSFYLHEGSTDEYGYFHKHYLRHQESVRAVSVLVPWPNQVGFSLVDSKPADCPNFDSGSALVELIDDQGNSTATSGIVTWKKGMGSLNSTGTPVPLPYDITNLSDGDWDITIDDGTNTISETITIDKSPNILPTITPSLSGLSCDPRLTTENYVSYDWKLNGAPVGSTHDFLANQNGTYTVSVIDQRGCSNSSKPYVLEIAPISTLMIESGSTNPNYTEVNIINYSANNTYEWILPPGAQGNQSGSKYFVEWGNLYNSGLPISCRITNACNVTSFVSTIPDCVGPHTYQNGSTQTSITNANFITQSGMVFNGLLKITSDFKFKDCGQVSFGPSAKILVMNGATLTIDNCDFGPSSTCCKMWKGIELEKGSKIIMMNNATISEAEFGLLVNDKSAFSISHSHFRNNYVGIKIGTGVPVDITGSYLSATDFYSEPYTCGGTTYYPFVQKYEGQQTNPGDYPLAGIQVDNCSYFKFGKYPNVSGGDIKFYNLSNGIISNNSQVYIVNTTFKNIVNDSHYDLMLANQNGCGIRATKSYLNFHGLGGQSTSDYTIENSKYGFLLESTDGEISDINSKSDTHVGAYIANSTKVDLTKNCWHAKWIGVWTYHNPDGQIQISYSSFKMSTTEQSLAGIRNDEFSLGNKITINNNSFLLNRGRYGIYSYGLDGAQIKQNDVAMNSNDNVGGIYAAYSSKNTYKCNSVYALQTYAARQFGFSFSLSRGNSIECNYTDKQFYGIRFLGSCTGTNLEGNNFHDHNYGLSLNFNGLIGTQYNTGNSWTGSYISYGAYLSGIDQNSAAVNQFDYYSGGNSVNQTTNNDSYGYNWFNGNGNPDEFSCVSFDCQPTIPNDEELKGEDEIIAEGNSIGVEFTEPSNYIADKFLFEKLESNPDLLINNPILQAFYDQELNGTIGLFTGLKDDIKTAVHWETVYSIVYSTNRTMIINYTDSIHDLDSLLELDPANQMLHDRISGMNDQVKSLKESNNQILDVVKQIEEYNRINAENSNSAIPLSEVYETNEASTNEIYLATVARGRYDFSIDQQTTLEGIIVQCPFTGGPAVYTAISLYALIDQTNDWNEDAICIASGISPRHVKPTFVNQFSLYPNPAYNLISIDYSFNEGSKGVVTVYNMLGVAVYTTILDKDSKHMDIDISALKPALYRFKITVDDFTEKQGSISVIR